MVYPIFKSTDHTMTTEKSSAEEWICQVKDEVKNLENCRSTVSARWRKQSIYRIPSGVAELCNSKAYTPHAVSIGPYHNGEEHLKAMEAHKRRALINFLSRSSNKPIECYLNALAKEVNNLKDAYDPLDEKYSKQDNEAFLQVMMVDGCFILELLRTTTAGPEELVQMGYADNDPVFSNHGRLYIVPYLKRDMLMLENQLPMLVLATLAAENNMPTKDNLPVKGEVTRLILEFFSQDHISSYTDINELGECFHILDVYRESLLRSPNDKETKTGDNLSRRRSDNGQDRDVIISTGDDGQHQHVIISTGDDQIIRSATELYEAGITIKPSETKSLRDITFNRGVLKLPSIVVDDTLESVYLNLMAFERFHVGAGNEVSSYIFFMDSIIDSIKDVSLLHSSGVIQNALGSDKAVANLFNTISKEIALDPNSTLGIVHKNVNKYCRKKCPSWMAILRHTYFNNPWVAVSVIAAIILFALTGIQTYYTVISYHNPTK